MVASLKKDSTEAAHALLLRPLAIHTSGPSGPLCPLLCSLQLTNPVNGGPRRLAVRHKLGFWVIFVQKDDPTCFATVGLCHDFLEGLETGLAEVVGPCDPSCLRDSLHTWHAYTHRHGGACCPPAYTGAVHSRLGLGKRQFGGAVPV